jgi:hypothetical protein
MLENGVYLPIDLSQSMEISYNSRTIFQLHVWEDSMYQISEGFSDKEVYEFNAKRYRTIKILHNIDEKINTNIEAKTRKKDEYMCKF